MVRNELSMQHLQLLKSLYETGSLTRTSAQMRLSRPRASRMLKGLREIFEDPLFVRTASGVSPTARMQELYPDIVDAIEAQKALFQERVFNPDDIDGVIRIAALDNAVLHYLADPISAIIATRPKIRFRIERFDRNTLLALEEGRIDFACFPMTDLPDIFGSIELDRTPRVVVARKDHPLCSLPLPLDPECVSRYRRIRNSARGDLGADIYRIPDVLQKTQVQAVTTPYFTSQASFLLHTDCVAFLPRRTAKLFLSMFPGKLRILPIQGIGGLILHPRLIWHRSSDLDPKSQWIRGMIASHQAPSDVDEDPSGLVRTESR